MAIILLPTIIRTTEETLKTVPESYRKAFGAGGDEDTDDRKDCDSASAPGAF
ncbi:MAG: hypothetical protein ACLR23_22655 [Clostridia bacterium]